MAIPLTPHGNVLFLYAARPRQEFQVGEPVSLAIDWSLLKKDAIEQLRSQRAMPAARLLEEFDFELRNASIGKLHLVVLVAEVAQEVYLELRVKIESNFMQSLGRRIARTIDQSIIGIEYIALALKPQWNAPKLPRPDLKLAVREVEAALKDAEILISKSGPPSAVDRVHTAMHGYFKALCTVSNLVFDPDDSLTALYKLLRTQHPELSDSSSKILKSLASAIDEINVLRNNASSAHPQELLEVPEALLAIHAGNSILHYLNARLL